MYAPITWPIALGKYRDLKSIIYDKSWPRIFTLTNGIQEALMHVKHLNTIKPKREANNVGILLAFILRNKCVFPVLHSHWVLFSFLILRNLTCLYTPIFLRLRDSRYLSICGLSGSTQSPEALHRKRQLYLVGSERVSQGTYQANNIYRMSMDMFSESWMTVTIWSQSIGLFFGFQWGKEREKESKVISKVALFFKRWSSSWLQDQERSVHLWNLRPIIEGAIPP